MKVSRKSNYTNCGMRKTVKITPFSILRMKCKAISTSSGGRIDGPLHSVWLRVPFKRCDRILGLHFNQRNLVRTITLSRAVRRNLLLQNFAAIVFIWKATSSSEVSRRANFSDSSAIFLFFWNFLSLSNRFNLFEATTVIRGVSLIWKSG